MGQIRFEKQNPETKPDELDDGDDADADAEAQEAADLRQEAAGAVKNIRLASAYNMVPTASHQARCSCACSAGGLLGALDASCVVSAKLVAGGKDLLLQGRTAHPSLAHVTRGANSPEPMATSQQLLRRQQRQRRSTKGGSWSKLC